MGDAVLAASGALLVAALNEWRASIRARQADADRREQLLAAVARAGQGQDPDPNTRSLDGPV